MAYFSDLEGGYQYWHSTYLRQPLAYLCDVACQKVQQEKDWGKSAIPLVEVWFHFASF